MSHRPTCPGCARECSREARHEARLVAHELLNKICPTCLVEIIRGHPALKDRIRVLESKVERLSRGRS